MDNRDKILEFIKIKGPVMPVQISKEIGTNILMASAHLAELTATGKLKISTIKIGDSPLYYLSGQEAMLQKYIGSFNDKEKRAYDLLQQDKILRDIEQEPVVRVALRGIKDFAIPLNVNHNNNREVFWKWYLTGNEEAEQLIKSKLDIAEKPADRKVEEKPIEKIAEEKRIEQLPAQKKDFQQKIEEKPIERQKPQKEKSSNASELGDERARVELSHVTRTHSQLTKKYKPRDSEDAFLKDIVKFFEKNKISIVSSEVIKKNSEIDFVVEIPSVVGSLQYYCKARNKKRISDSDLTNAYVKGQFKKLPVLVVSPGELSAKAQDIIGKELSNLAFKKI